MNEASKNFVVAAYIPCKTCGEPCVSIERFAESPSDDFLDRHMFHATCSNCLQTQVRVGRDAFQRTIVEWKFQPEPTGLSQGAQS